MKTSTKTQLIPTSVFIDMCADMKGCTFFSAKYRGYVSKMKKTGNPYPNALVTYRFTGALNYNYEEAVNRRRNKNGLPTNFVAQARKWGEHRIVNGYRSCVVDHKGKSYLNVLLRMSGKRQYISNGRFIPASVIAPFISDPPNFLKSQGLYRDKGVDTRDYAFDNLTEVTLNHVKYVLT